jgi:opacity protein-like surface antigen
MNKRNGSILTALFVGLFLLTSIPPAHAGEDQDWKYAATVVVGGAFSDLGDNLSDVGLDLPADFSFGWRFEYRFHPNWGVEGSWHGAWAKAEISGSEETIDLDPMYLSGNMVYHFSTQGPLKPFVTAGAGTATWDIDRESVGDSENNFAINFGGGFLWPVHDHVSLRGEVRNYTYKVDNISAASAEALGVPADYKQRFNDLGIYFGVSFTF